MKIPTILFIIVVVINLSEVGIIHLQDLKVTPIFQLQNSVYHQGN